MNIVRGLIIVFLLLPNIVNCQMTGGSFSIPIDSFSISDNSEITGDDYSLFDSTGYNEMSTSTGNSYYLYAGFHEELANSVTLGLSASSVSLGTLSQSEVADSSITATISTDSITGYTLSISKDGNLRTGSFTIANVSDGAVSAGAEEYGIRTSGVNGLLNSSDTAITDNLNIASSLATASSEAITINFKASVGPSSKAGDYTQIITFTLTANP